MASNSNNNPVPADELHGLLLLARDHTITNLRLYCPHIYYSSDQMFVDHLIWFTTQDAMSENFCDHQEVLSILLKRFILCDHCRNSMLSSYALLEQLSVPNLKCRMERTCCINYNVECIRFLLYSRLVDHPQSPRIIMKICKNSVTAFQSMCEAVADILYWDRCSEQSRILKEYADIVCLTVKYWSRDQLRYFLESHFNVIDRAIVPEMRWLARNLKSSMNEFNSNVKDPVGTLSFLLFEVIAISNLMGLHGVPQMVGSSIKLLDKSKSKQSSEINRETMKGVVKDRSVCSYEECEKLDNEEQFKLCGGCKLTYYCCRSCQKRAWPQHKVHCKTLCSLYAL